MQNINISINNQNTIETKFPRIKQCSDNKVLYRVSYGYKSKLSGNKIFPVTYENFNEGVRKTIPIIFPGDIVIYTPQFKEDVNYNRPAIVKKITSQYKGREAQSRGMAVDPDKDKTTLYDLEFINPIVGRDGGIKKERKNLKRLNKNGSVQLTKTQDEVYSYICAESPVPYMLIHKYNTARNANPIDTTALRRAEDALWNHNFRLNDNLQPLYPLMRVLPDAVKTKLNKEVEKMVKVGFLLGKKEQQPQVKKKKGKWVISFMMPKNSKPGDSITLPIASKKYTINVVVKIPIVTGEDRHTPTVNEYLKDVPIDEQENADIFDNLKKIKAKTVDTEFNPTFIKAQDYVGSDSQKDLDMLVKPGTGQKFFINNASIIKQDGNNFSFKKLGLFDKESSTLVFDLYVTIDLNLTMKLPPPEDISKDSAAGKMKRKAFELILNGPNNCPGYMTKIRKGASRLFSSMSPNIIIPAAVNAVSNMQKRVREKSVNRKIRRERASGRSDVRRGGGRRKTRKRKCHKKASRRVMRCWKKKTKRKFKKCWKKGRKTYKKCKKWKKAEKKLKSCKRKKKRTRRKKQRGGYGLPGEHHYFEEIDN